MARPIKIDETGIEEKVVRAYNKGISLSAMSNFGICGSEKAAKILHKLGLMRKKNESRPFETGGK